MAPSGPIVVTGASTGIGAACALHLDRLGLRVFAGVRKETDARALQRQASYRLTPLTIDVTDEATIAGAVAVVAAGVSAMGLGGLVNNAGIAVAGPLEFIPPAELRRQYEVNVIGHVAVTQAFLPLLRQGAPGRIVNVGSIAGRVTAPFFGPYSSSKFALEALTTALRLELRPWGIHVAIVEPGAIATPIWEKSIAAGDVLIEQMPARMHTLYGRAIAKLREDARASGRGGAPPSAVARAVAHALTAEHPRTRYPVGRDARVGELVRLLPEGLRERLLSRL